MTMLAWIPTCNLSNHLWLNVLLTRFTPVTVYSTSNANMRQGISEPIFYGDLVYKLKT